MAKYTFFKAEARQYSLGDNIDFVRARMMARDLAEKVKGVQKTDETIALKLFRKGGDQLPDTISDEIQLSYALFQGNLLVKTELLYLDGSGNITIAEHTVDDYDEYLDCPISMFDLATFIRTKKTERFEPEGELLLKIHPLHQIGVNPQFLYDFGDKYGRRM